MEAYRPIMLNGSYLVALYAVAYISAPLTPQGILEYVVLALASAWLLFGLYNLQKEHRRPSSMFFGAIALIPWAFYGELWYINSNNDGIDPQVFEQNLKHAIMVYQSFKYVIMACAVGAALKGLWLSFKNFGSTV